MLHLTHANITLGAEIQRGVKNLIDDGSLYILGSSKLENYKNIFKHVDLSDTLEPQNWSDDLLKSLTTTWLQTQI